MTGSSEAVRTAFDDVFGAGASARVPVSCHGREENRKFTELVISLAGDVAGTAPLADLIHAAEPAPPGCLGGIVERAPF
jgi:ribonuclease T2